MGPSAVLVTSVERPDAPTLRPSRCWPSPTTVRWIVRTPRLPIKANGSGDVTAALFTAHYRSTGDADRRAARTTSSVFDLLQHHSRVR